MSARADSQRWRSHRRASSQRQSSRVWNRGNRNTRTDNPTRYGGTRHRYRNRRVTHDHRTLRRAGRRDRPAEPGHRHGAPARKAAFDHQRHYPGSSSRELVCRILVRHRDSATALDKTSNLFSAASSKQRHASSRRSRRSPSIRNGSNFCSSRQMLGHA